ncbi:TraI domain-containing protein [Flavobacterium sp.]|uniref:TraI domain-containing protein n=1 Tax=Flavobacterium sp. TaxID=239 RepID=UPI0026206E04|nr:TraI domain-containing protein [Flavobacterium sp.]
MRKILSVDELVKRNQDKIERLRFTTTSNFDSTHMPIIRLVASWFNSLPISKDLWEEPGGGFRCSIESALFCVEQSRNAIFTAHLTSNLRKEIEPQYRYAAFIAGMLSWLEEPYRNFRVLVDQEEFHPVGMFLTDAIDTRDSYEIKNREFIEASSRQMTLMFATPIITSSFDQISDLKVRKDLVDAIATPRLKQGIETTLQTVIRKGLGQAEECERRSKALLVKSEERQVTPVQIIDSIVADTHSDKPEAGTGFNPSPPQANARADESKPKQATSAEVNQGTLDIGADDIAKLPKALRELLGALIYDIKQGKKERSQMQFLETGNYLIPKKFFNGYGRDQSKVIEELREQKLVIGNDQHNVLVVPSLGSLLQGAAQ